MNRTLINTGWRYLLRHPWQSILMVVGITLGVAVMVAIDLANASASRAFDLSTESVSGRATHQISGGPLGLEEEVYTRLRTSGLVDAAAPVVSDYVSSPQLGGRPLQLLGVDPFAEPPFRDYLGGAGGGAQSSRPAPATGDLTTFLTQPGAALISTGLAERYQVESCRPSPQAQPEPDCQVTLEIAGRFQPAFVAGLLEPADSLSQRALENLVLVDIATAQELTGRLGYLDRIDLILPESSPAAQAALVRQIEEMLPEGATLEAINASGSTVEQMTQAFQVNLTAMSLLALVVGMFLIYNTMTFSVVQRRPLFGTLRCLGVTRREVFTLVIGEAVLVGLTGALLGVGLGILMGQGAVRMVTTTINDLFFVLNVSGVQIPVSSLVKGFVVGLLATVATAAPPAWEAASVPPRMALSRSGLEDKARRIVTLAALAGLGTLAGGTAILLIPTRSLFISFTGTFAVIIGFAMLAPFATRVLLKAIAAVFGRLFGMLGRMAPRDVSKSLSRTAIAVAALMIAVSVTIGVSLMVGSFRHTVVLWLEQTLQGDIYISAPNLAAARPSEVIDPQVIDELRAWPGVEQVDVVRSTTVDSPDGPLLLAATDNAQIGEERIFLTLTGSQDAIWERLMEGAVLVSEPLANHLDLRPGPDGETRITFNTNQGLRSFPVMGVYYDYASPQGTVMMALPLYRQLFDDPAITSVSLRLDSQTDPDQAASAMQESLGGEQMLLVRANRALRADVLTVFDRTFAITGALQLLATVVAFIGILSALLSLELERQRELGILRAVGMTVHQLWSLIMLETGIMGAIAGLLSMPTGYALAVILVYIINRRSFGWTLQMQVTSEPFLQAFAVAVFAALLAGIYPTLRIGRMAASEALRAE